MYSWTICEFVTFFSKLRRPGEVELRTRRFATNRFKPYLRATSQFVRSLAGRREYWIPIVEDFIVCLSSKSGPAAGANLRKYWSARVENPGRLVGSPLRSPHSPPPKYAMFLLDLDILWARALFIKLLCRDDVALRCPAISIVHTIPTASGGRGLPEKDKGFLHLLTKVTDL